MDERPWTRATVIMEPMAFGVFYQNCSESPFFFWVLLLNCAIAFSVNLTNFLVTKCTSPLTLQVLGNAKGAVAAGPPVYSYARVGCSTRGSSDDPK